MTEVAHKLDRLLERFAGEIEAFLNGGLDLRQKHLEEAERAGLDPEGIANLADSWDKAEALRAKREVEAPPLQPAQAEPRIKVRLLNDPGRPKPVAKATDDVGPSKTGAALQVSGNKDFAKELGEALEAGTTKPNQERAEPKPETKAEGEEQAGLPAVIPITSLCPMNGYRDGMKQLMQ
jgi:hypothetical protein